jgi:hypothetical protein
MRMLQSVHLIRLRASGRGGVAKVPISSNQQISKSVLSFRFVSFRFVSFRFVSFRFVGFDAGRHLGRPLPFFAIFQFAFFFFRDFTRCVKRSRPRAAEKRPGRASTLHSVVYQGSGAPRDHATLLLAQYTGRLRGLSNQSHYSPVVARMRLSSSCIFFILILFRGNRQIPGLATGAVGHSLFYSRR